LAASPSLPAAAAASVAAACRAAGAALAARAALTAGAADAAARLLPAAAAGFVACLAAQPLPDGRMAGSLPSVSALVSEHGLQEAGVGQVRSDSRE
jgi:hypothetical protein